MMWRQWLSDTQDWCVSRQLWWGHRIPAFALPLSACPPDVVDELHTGGVHGRVSTCDGQLWIVAADKAAAQAELRKVWMMQPVLNGAV
jgi:valyl-tRNA synthetase